MGKNRSKQDRVTIDATGLRDRAANAYDSPLWRELSLSKQLRLLAIERLEQLEAEREKNLQND